MVKTRQRGIYNGVTSNRNSNVYSVETRSRSKTVVPDLIETISQISDSDDTEYRLPRKRRQRDLTPNDEKLSKYGKRNTVSSTITRLATRQHVHLGDDSDHQLQKTDQKIQSSSSHSCNSHLYMNGNLKNAKAPCVRRSPRQRKLIYDNLNQTWLLASSIPDLAKFDNLFSTNKKINRDVEKISSKGIETRRSYELRKLGLSSPDIEFDDMYSRVKRQRRKTVRDLYARRISRNANTMTDSEETDQNESMDDEGGTDLEASGVSGEEESQEENHPKYCLRPKKPITERFQFPIEPTRQKKSSSSQLFHSSSHIRHRDRHLFRSPAHKSAFFKRKHHAVHNSSSTCTSSDDERHFEQRKARSMARARNRCLPMNFDDDDLKHGVLRDRNRIGCSLADVDPMSINKSIMFDSIGGLDHHIRSLKEMIIFPLLYPEVFEKFKITPPRGVLFHGPPGTGKTLVARALANECSQGDRRIAFFMRKGADCLSKWVGESERQLRLLFDQAFSMRPSIIFFDEIDGLAPVRSTRQDQIHSSIVSTLLALMDGLDSRGEIVIIGATNRIDAIDPALRRPGRFDRELHFPLPSLEARCRILKIHTKEWNPSLSEKFAYELALESSGYCGADLKALCTEAALMCLRRHYPQIYKSRQKLVLDVNSIQILPQDFYRAMRKIIPVTQRSSTSPVRPLISIIKPLLQNTLLKAIELLENLFPAGTKYISDMNTRRNEYSFATCEEVSSDEEVENPISLKCDSSNCHNENEKCISHLLSKEARHSQFYQPPNHRPRFLLSGKKNQGQSIHLAPAILHYLEHIPVHKLDLPTIYTGTFRTPEEACEQIFREAKRNLPSIIYLPRIGRTWKTLNETVQETFLTLLHDLESNAPLLIIATSDCHYHELPSQIQDMFDINEGEVLRMENPISNERREFFSSLLLQKVFLPPKQKSRKARLEPLPVAPLPEPRILTESELQRLRQQEEATLTELRIFLRAILTKLAKDRKFSIFAKPVDPTVVPDYLEVIKNPMDLETMMTKIDHYHYETVTHFLEDIDRICDNALEYNPVREPTDRLIRHRACALKDTAHALVDSELDEQFEKMCQDIHEARLKRGEINKYIPKPYQTQPTNEPSETSLTTKSTNVIPTTSTSEACATNDNAIQSYSTRYSKRQQRSHEVISNNTETVKKTWQNCAKPASNFAVVRRRKSAWFGSRTIYRRPIHCNKNESFKLQNDTKMTKDMSSSSVVDDNSVNSLVSSKVINNYEDHTNSMNDSDVYESMEIDTPNGKDQVCSNSIRSDLSQELGNVPIEDANVHLSEVNSQDSSGLSTSPCATGNVCDKTNLENSCSKAFNSEKDTSTDTYSNLTNDKQENLINKNKDSSGEVETQESEVNSEDQITETSENTQEIQKEIVIDQDRLYRLLNKLVLVTNDWSVDSLEKSYRVLDSCIYKHRQSWDKEALLAEMETEVESFSQFKPVS